MSDFAGHFANPNSHNTVQNSLIKIFSGIEEDSEGKSNAEILECIREEIAHTLLCRYDVVIYYEVYKKICLFLEARRIPCLQILESGKLIARRVICAIWTCAKR